jgi:hypothetical protein
MSIRRASILSRKRTKLKSLTGMMLFYFIMYVCSEYLICELYNSRCDEMTVQTMIAVKKLTQRGKRKKERKKEKDKTKTAISKIPIATGW